MKRIMKIASVLAAVAALASCAEKENPVSGNTEVPGGKGDALANTEIVATFESTKVSYAEEGTNLRPSWEVGDVVIAIADGVYAGETSRFTVKSVNEDGSAILQGRAYGNCSLHLVYCPGAKEGTEIPVDYTAQTGAQKTMPAVMLSDGEVKEGKGEFKFRNAGAIIGISAVKGVPSGATISKITIEGSNLSAATIALSGSALALTATEKANDAISVNGLNLTVNDANGTLSSPIFIAVPAGAKITKVSVPVTKEPETMTIPSTSADKKDIDYVEIAAKYDGTNVTTKKWAKWNVGANSQSDYGWYFAWGGTEGYVPTEISGTSCKWVSASGVDSYSYTLSSAKTTVASDYLYVKTQSFAAVGHSFDWAHTPYHTGSVESTGWTKYIPTGKSSYWTGSGDPDNKLVLDPEDDAARANWREPWRMPTSAEFQALYNATKWTWDSTDKGYYVTEKGVTLSGDKSNALLFFPAAGYGLNASLNRAGSYGYYWSSSLRSSNPSHAYYLGFYGGNVNPQYYDFRYYGRSVRPLSD